MLEYKQISPQQTHDLRHRILRPQQDIVEMVYPLDSEEGSCHIGAFEGDTLLGIASLYPESQAGKLNQGIWRIRGMAVEESCQGKGIGQQLVQLCIEYAKEQKAESVWCNARTSAIGFYLKIGFEQLGDEFEIKGIGPHYIACLKL